MSSAVRNPKPKTEVNLKKMSSVLFFVYGTLKEGHWNHHRLSRPRVEYLGDFITKPEFTMVNCGAYPAVLKTGDTSIMGELYRTNNPAVIESVCQLEGFNGIMGDPRNGFYDVTEIETPHGTAYMFIFKKNNGYPVIETGYWPYKK